MEAPLRSQVNERLRLSARQSFSRFDGIETGLWIPVLTRFLDANRCPLRLKTL
jgi:hypothetical protein